MNHGEPRRTAVLVRFGILLLGVTTACNDDQFAKAQEEYEILEKTSGSNAEMCAAAREIQRAAVREGKSDEAKFWGPIADQRCLMVQIEGPD